MGKADELFRRYGFLKTTVADIAHGLQMSPANVYKFFPSKNAIFEACAERNIAAMQEEVSRIVGSPTGALRRLEEAVLAIFRFYKELLKNEREIFKLVLTARENGWCCIRDYNGFLLAAFARLVREGVRKGEFRRVDPTTTAQILRDCLHLALHPHLRHDGSHDNGEDRVRAQIRFLARALRQGAATPSRG